MAFFVGTQKRGFTLKEILIVGAIIALLASTVLVGAQNARKVARDKQRVSDLQQVQLALRLHKDKEGTYPSYDNGAIVGNNNALDSLIAPYVSGTIADPINNATYRYHYDSSHDCSGTPRVILLARSLESGVGNYSTVCDAVPERLNPADSSTYLPSANNTYVILLQ